MAYRTFIIAALATLCVPFNSTAHGQGRIGDWDYGVEGRDTDAPRRVASTAAQTYSGTESRPSLVIRRVKPDDPVELFVVATHDIETDKCEYKNWKVAIDSFEIPVLGYTFEPAKTELKADWGTKDDDLWGRFKKGFKLSVEVEQKCESAAGVPSAAQYSFSLRGSHAAFNYIEHGID